jgi:hypothetical protein
MLSTVFFLVGILLFLLFIWGSMFFTSDQGSNNYSVMQVILCCSKRNWNIYVFILIVSTLRWTGGYLRLKKISFFDELNELLALSHFWRSWLLMEHRVSKQELGPIEASVSAHYEADLVVFWHTQDLFLGVNDLLSSHSTEGLNLVAFRRFYDDRYESFWLNLASQYGHAVHFVHNPKEYLRVARLPNRVTLVAADFAFTKTDTGRFLRSLISRARTGWIHDPHRTLSDARWFFSLQPYLDTHRILLETKTNPKLHIYCPSRYFDPEA